MSGAGGTQGDGNGDGGQGAPEAREAREVRGVFNPRVVDLVSFDAGRDEVTLLMIEDRPWESDPQQLRQLEAKFNAYLEYALGGHLAKDYPQYAGKDVCFELECAEVPRGEAAAMLRAMENFAAGEGLRLVVKRIESAS